MCPSSRIKHEGSMVEVWLHSKSDRPTMHCVGTQGRPMVKAMTCPFKCAKMSHIAGLDITCHYNHNYLTDTLVHYM